MSSIAQASTASRIFQSFLNDAVAKGIAPGFQCCVFNRKGLVFNGVSGLASLPSKNLPEGKLFRPETTLWTASCTKLSVSLIVFHILERGWAKAGFSINDLDNHEALVKVLPEFKHGSGSLVTKILEGFEDELGPDGRRVMKLRDAKVKVTLRMLLTHTAGMAYRWNNSLLYELCAPSDGSVPHFGLPGSRGDIREISLPLVIEPNTIFSYGQAADWVGQFAVRSSGKSLRQLFMEIIFAPLDIPLSEADMWFSPIIEANLADMHARDTDGDFKKLPKLETYSTEEAPPPGKTYNAGGGLLASCQAYTKILQAVLNHDTRLLSEEVWKMVIKDDLKGRGIAIPRPAWKAAIPTSSHDVDVYAKSTAEDGAGVNFLQCNVAYAPTVSGRSIGSFSWAGLANIYYFIDPARGVGAIFGTQLLPFYDSKIIEMRDALEALVIETLCT